MDTLFAGSFLDDPAESYTIQTFYTVRCYECAYVNPSVKPFLVFTTALYESAKTICHVHVGSHLNCCGSFPNISRF